MPNTCAAINCTNRSSKTTGISYFRFPLHNKELTKQWVINMKRDKWYPSRFACICSEHFEDKFMYIAGERRKLLAKAIPTIFSFDQNTLGKKRMIKESVLLSSNQLGETAHNNFIFSIENHSVDDHPYCLPQNCVLEETNENLRKQVNLIEGDDCANELVIKLEPATESLHQTNDIGEHMFCVSDYCANELVIKQESPTENLYQTNDVGELWSKLKCEVKNLTGKLNELEKKLQPLLRHYQNQM